VSEQPGFTLVQLRYFVASAESGSMTAAAEQLLIAQSAISAAACTRARRQFLIPSRGRG